MSIRKVNRRKLRKWAAGDMRELIKLLDRNIEAPDFGVYTIDMAFDILIECFAFVETISKGPDIFDDVNTGPEQTPTHRFIIRHVAPPDIKQEITTEVQIQWQDEYYKILEVENPEMRDEYLILSARLKGADDAGANE